MNCQRMLRIVEEAPAQKNPLEPKLTHRIYCHGRVVISRFRNAPSAPPNTFAKPELFLAELIEGVFSSATGAFYVPVFVDAGHTALPFPGFTFSRPSLITTDV